MGGEEFPEQGELLSISFSGDSTSLSPTRMSARILCAKGEGAPGGSTQGRFLAL